MASFNNGQIVFVNKTTGTITPQATELTLYNNNSKLNSKDGSGNVYELMTNSSTSPLTGSLQFQINNLASTLTPLVTTSAISAGLQSQINSINVVAGTNVTINQNEKTWTISSIGGGNSWFPIQGNGMSITPPQRHHTFLVLSIIFPEHK